MRTEKQSNAKTKQISGDSPTCCIYMEAPVRFILNNHKSFQTFIKMHQSISKSGNVVVMFPIHYYPEYHVLSPPKQRQKHNFGLMK